MATITEDYVGFEVARLLKEKGFTENCLMRYNKVGDLVEEAYKFNWNFQTIDYSAPTLQMVMKWLRYIFHLEIYPFHDAIQENNDWWYRVERHSKGCGLTEHESDVIYKTYEQACEAAIKYCLENLI